MPTNTLQYSRSEHNFVNQLYFSKNQVLSVLGAFGEAFSLSGRINFHSSSSGVFPNGSACQEPACQCRRPRSDPWIGKIPWRRNRLPTPVFSPGESHGQRSPVGYRPWGHRELDMTEVTGHSTSQQSAPVPQRARAGRHPRGQELQLAGASPRNPVQPRRPATLSAAMGSTHGNKQKLCCAQIRGL